MKPKWIRFPRYFAWKKGLKGIFLRTYQLEEMSAPKISARATNSYKYTSHWTSFHCTTKGRWGKLWTKNGVLHKAKQEWHPPLSRGRSHHRGKDQRLLWWGCTTTPHKASTKWLFSSICRCFLQCPSLFFNYTRINTIPTPPEWSPREG